MSISIGSNILASRANRSLAESSYQMARVFERLSSGQRINRASDDAAGLSISTSLGAKARILGRASLNLSDAGSLLNIADGALSQVSTVLSRMAELSEQAANGSYSSTQRKNLNREFGQLRDEVVRITGSTKFNGLSLLEGNKSANPLRAVIGGTSIAHRAVSTDGRFQVAIDNADLKVRDRDTGEIRTVAIPGGTTSTVGGVLANGDVVLFDGSNGDIYRYSYESNSMSRIVASAQAFPPTSLLKMSADGTALVFTTRRTIYQEGGSGFSGTATADALTERMYKLDLETNTINLVTSSGTSFGQLSLSNDGTYLGYTLSGQAVVTNLETMTSRTSSSTVVGVAGVSNEGLMYFTMTGTPISQFGSLDWNTGVTRQLSSFTSPSNILDNIQLSADGHSIFFASYSDLTGENSLGNTQLFKLDVRDGTIEQRSDYRTNILEPFGPGGVLISQDGSTIFATDEDANFAYEVDMRKSGSTFDFEAGFGAAGNIRISMEALLSSISGVQAHDLTSAISARGALYRLRQNIEALGRARGVIGAGMSRLQAASELSKSQQIESLAAAGRIRDADMAVESANLTRLQIVQRAAASVLAQASQQPQLALRLLSS